jgi:hypothetical protein
VVIERAEGEPAAKAAREIVETLRAWRDHPEEVRRLGERGREAFLDRYERAPNCAAWEDVIARAWEGRAEARVIRATALAEAR